MMRTDDHDPETTTIAVALAQFARHRKRVAIRHDRGEWTYSDLLAACIAWREYFRCRGYAEVMLSRC
jgi:hypothetical protein